MAGGPIGDMFRLLTADPVRGVADLPRAGQETALARGLPGDLRPSRRADRGVLRRAGAGYRMQGGARSGVNFPCIAPPFSPCSAALAPGDDAIGARPTGRLLVGGTR